MLAMNANAEDQESQKELWPSARSPSNDHSQQELKLSVQIHPSTFFLYLKKCKANFSEWWLLRLKVDNYERLVKLVYPRYLAEFFLLRFVWRVGQNSSTIHSMYQNRSFLWLRHIHNHYILQIGGQIKRLIKGLLSDFFENLSSWLYSDTISPKLVNTIDRWMQKLIFNFQFSKFQLQENKTTVTTNTK